MTVGVTKSHVWNDLENGRLKSEVIKFVTVKQTPLLGKEKMNL